MDHPPCPLRVGGGPVERRGVSAPGAPVHEPLLPAVSYRTSAISSGRSGINPPADAGRTILNGKTLKPSSSGSVPALLAVGCTAGLPGIRKPMRPSRPQGRGRDLVRLRTYGLFAFSVESQRPSMFDGPSLRSSAMPPLTIRCHPEIGLRLRAREDYGHTGPSRRDISDPEKTGTPCASETER